MECDRDQDAVARKTVNPLLKDKLGAQTLWPKCEPWLIFGPKMMIIKNGGLFTLLRSSVVNVFIDNNDYHLMCSF